MWTEAENNFDQFLDKFIMHELTKDENENSNNNVSILVPTFIYRISRNYRYSNYLITHLFDRSKVQGEKIFIQFVTTVITKFSTSKMLSYTRAPLDTLDYFEKRFF